jgi:ATP:corrinoid adenosyltransferase
MDSRKGLLLINTVTEMREVKHAYQKGILA